MEEGDQTKKQQNRRPLPKPIGSGAPKRVQLWQPPPPTSSQIENITFTIPLLQNSSEDSPQEMQDVFPGISNLLTGNHTNTQSPETIFSSTKEEVAAIDNGTDEGDDFVKLWNTATYSLDNFGVPWNEDPEIAHYRANGSGTQNALDNFGLAYDLTTIAHDLMIQVRDMYGEDESQELFNAMGHFVENSSSEPEIRMPVPAPMQHFQLNKFGNGSVAVAASEPEKVSDILESNSLAGSKLLGYIKNKSTIDHIGPNQTVPPLTLQDSGYNSPVNPPHSFIGGPMHSSGQLLIPSPTFQPVTSAMASHGYKPVSSRGHEFAPGKTILPGHQNLTSTMPASRFAPPAGPVGYQRMGFQVAPPGYQEMSRQVFPPAYQRSASEIALSRYQRMASQMPPPEYQQKASQLSPPGHQSTASQMSPPGYQPMVSQMSPHGYHRMTSQMPPPGYERQMSSPGCRRMASEMTPPGYMRMPPPCGMSQMRLNLQPMMGAQLQPQMANPPQIYVQSPNILQTVLILLALRNKANRASTNDDCVDEFKSSQMSMSQPGIPNNPGTANVQRPAFSMPPAPMTRSQLHRRICVFCKKNGENQSLYTNHHLHDPVTGEVTCPVLQKYICPRCGSTGKIAHTEYHCPLNGIRSNLAILLGTIAMANEQLNQMHRQ